MKKVGRVHSPTFLVKLGWDANGNALFRYTVHREKEREHTLTVGFLDKEKAEPPAVFWKNWPLLGFCYSSTPREVSELWILGISSCIFTAQKLLAKSLRWVGVNSHPSPQHYFLGSLHGSLLSLLTVESPSFRCIDLPVILEGHQGT